MRLAKRKVGFIGIDVGTAALKVAQVARGKQGWRMIASAVVPRSQKLDVSAGLTSTAVSSLDQLQATRSLQHGYRGRTAAAVLPMGVCDLHRLERDLSRDPNPESALRRTIETATQRSTDSLLCEFWSGPATESASAWTQALALPRSWSEQISEDIASAGWSCKAIDGLPMSIARAVNMVHANPDQKPVAALDWGNLETTLCLIENQQPTYVRTLKVPGIHQLVDDLEEALEVSSDEAQGLLERYGLAGEAVARYDQLAKLIKDMVTKSVDALESELQRSFSHFQFIRRAKSPEQLYLMGGGSLIRGLAERLTQRLDISAAQWRLTRHEDRAEHAADRSESVLATAIALSALAWEVE